MQTDIRWGVRRHRLASVRHPCRGRIRHRARRLFTARWCEARARLPGDAPAGRIVCGRRLCDDTSVLTLPYLPAYSIIMIALHKVAAPRLDRTAKAADEVAAYERIDSTHAKARRLIERGRFARNDDGGIAITVVATQDTVESDSFNNTYDANATYPVVANVPGAHVIFNIVFFITIVSLVIQGTTVSWVARLLGLSTPLEKTGNDFGVELPEEIDSNLHDMTITQEMLEQADTLKDMNLPKGTLVMIVKRGDEYLIPNGTLKLHAGDKLLLISENSKE